MKLFIPVLVLCSLTAYGYGLDSSAFNLVDPPTMGSLGFQNYRSTATFSLLSSSRGSWGQGSYVGSMDFSLHPKVTGSLDLGYARIFNFSGGGNFGHMLGGLELEWRPTDSSVFVLQYNGAIPTGHIEGF